MAYRMIVDSGHGWLKVTHNELRQLGIADKISLYSYSNGEYAYLEEDCDAGVFIDAKGGIGNVPHSCDYYDGSCFVRYYNSYPVKK